MLTRLSYQVLWLCLTATIGPVAGATERSAAPTPPANAEAPRDAERAAAWERFLDPALPTDDRLNAVARTAFHEPPPVAARMEALLTDRWVDVRLRAEALGDLPWSDKRLPVAADLLAEARTPAENLAVLKGITGMYRPYQPSAPAHPYFDAPVANRVHALAVGADDLDVRIEAARALMESANGQELTADAITRCFVGPRSTPASADAATRLIFGEMTNRFMTDGRGWGPRYAGDVVKLLDRDDPKTVLLALEVCGIFKSGEPEILHLIRRQPAPLPEVRTMALQTLAKIGTAASLPAALDLLCDPSEPAASRQDAADIIERVVVYRKQWIPVADLKQLLARINATPTGRSDDAGRLRDTIDKIDAAGRKRLADAATEG